MWYQPCIPLPPHHHHHHTTPNHPPMHQAMHHPCTDPCTAQLACNPNPILTPLDIAPSRLHTAAIIFLFTLRIISTLEGIVICLKLNMGFWAKQFLKNKYTHVDFGLVIFNITTKTYTSCKINIKGVRMNILVHKNTYY